MSVEQLVWLLLWVFQRRLKGSWVNASAGHRGAHLGGVRGLSQDTGGVFCMEILETTRAHKSEEGDKGREHFVLL